MRTTLPAWLACGVVSLTAGSGRAPCAELYRRAEILEERIGRFELRSAYAVRLTVPVPCAGSHRGCPEPRIYDEVVRLDFALEHRELVGGEVVRTEEPRGTIHLALAFTPDDLESFRDELRALLRGLSAQAFTVEFAGFVTGEPPFDATMSERSVQPTFACFENGRTTVSRFYREIHPDGGISMGNTSGAAPEAPLCEEMRAATAAAHPDVLSTLSAPTRLLEATVSYQDVVAIDTRDTEALAARPPEIRLFKRQGAKEVTGEADGATDGFATSQRLEGGWRWDAYARPASLPLDGLDRNAWLQLWYVEIVERQLGIEPRERIADRTTLRLAHLPTDPPTIAEAIALGGVTIGPENPAPPETGRPRPAGPAEIDRAAFLGAVAHRLDEADAVDGKLLEDLVKFPSAGLESEGWVVVVCREDGSASYTLPPTRAEQSLTNADTFCAALESRLGRAR